MLKALKCVVSVDKIDKVQDNWSYVMQQATNFIAACFGQSNATSMSEVEVLHVDYTIQ